jgi:hypothetical protein
VWPDLVNIGAACVMGHGLGGRGSIPGRDKKLYSSAQCPDRLWPSSGCLCSGLPAVKQPEREAYHSPSSSVEFTKGGSIPPLRDTS